MHKLDRIFISSYQGIIGQTVKRVLHERGYANVITREDAELDLTDKAAVLGFFTREKPEYVFLATPLMGGIQANLKYPADFIYTNLQVQNNVINGAWQSGVKKLLFWGSSCSYPKAAPQPLKEESLLTGELEASSEPYAIAKIAGMKMCLAYNRQYGTKFIAALPSDVYGPGDDFDFATGHFLASLIRRFHEAKMQGDAAVTVWGTGKPRRECLYAEDLADASIYLMENYEGAEIINIGSGQDYAIGEIARMIAAAVGYDGDIVFDTSKPDGTARKLLDTGAINRLGWKPAVPPEDGIRRTYEWYLENIVSKEREKSGK